MIYKILFTKQALKDYEKIKASPLKNKIKDLLLSIEQTPLQPPVEKLSGNLLGTYSKKINLQHRLVYRIDEDKNIIVILHMCTYYGDN